MNWWAPLIVLVCTCTCILAVAAEDQVKQHRKRTAVAQAPDYLRIRQLERDLGLEVTPFPDWLPQIVLPTTIGQKYGLSGPVPWAQAAEILDVELKGEQ